MVVLAKNFDRLFGLWSSSQPSGAQQIVSTTLTKEVIDCTDFNVGWLKVCEGEVPVVEWGEGLRARSFLSACPYTRRWGSRRGSGCQS